MSDHDHATAGRSLRRVGGAALSVLLGLAAVAALIVFFNSRDSAEVQPSGSAVTDVPGTPYDDPARYLDGAQARLLSLGNVYVVFSRPSPELTALRDELSGAPDPALEEAGQAVVLVRRAGVDGVVALAAGHRLVTGDPADPELERFAAHWLGRGAG